MATPHDGPGGEQLDAADDLSGKLAALTKAVKHSHFIHILMAMSLALDILLSVVLGGVLASHIRLDTTVRNNQIANCVSQNATRVKDLAIWDAVLKPVPGESASTKVLRAEINKLVITKDTTNVCRP